MFVDEKAAGEKQPVQVGKLKLSAAIRIGAKKRPQCNGHFFAEGGSCAIGAALEALTGLSNFEDDRVPSPETAWPEMRHLSGKVYDMNDGGFTREEIADWLESKGF